MNLEYKPATLLFVGIGFLLTVLIGSPVVQGDLTGPGDIAFVGLNADGQDDLAIVLLVDAPVGTTFTVQTSSLFRKAMMLRLWESCVKETRGVKFLNLLTDKHLRRRRQIDLPILRRSGRWFKLGRRDYLLNMLHVKT